MSDTNYETIKYDVAENIATITLNRPEVYNAFNDPLSKELKDAIKNASRAKDVRVVILTGEGKAFSSGQDLGDLKEKYVPGHVPHLGADLKKRYDPIIKGIVQMDKPVIAAVNGVAAGAGCSLALACDMRIASEYAMFIEVFIKVGLVPDSGSTFFLPRLVGHAKAMELCCTATPVKAPEALDLGIVNKVVPAADLIPTTRALAASMVALPARGIALTKRLLNKSWTNSLDEQLVAEAYDQETAGMTEDHTEGVMAFIEKRDANFKGC